VEKIKDNHSNFSSCFYLYSLLL